MITFSQTSGFLGSFDLVPIFSAVSIVVVAIASIKAIDMAIKSFQFSGLSSSTVSPSNNDTSLLSNTPDISADFDHPSNVRARALESENNLRQSLSNTTYVERKIEDYEDIDF